MVRFTSYVGHEDPHVRALHNALLNQLLARMTAAGWEPDPAADLGMGDGVVGDFRNPLNDEFAATAWFAWFGDYPPLRVDTSVGVSYQRSYRVWPSLLGQTHTELRAGVEVLDRNPAPVELWELDEVDRAVDALITPVLKHAVSWAEPFGSVDALLDAISGSPDELIAELIDIPVVLAAAGRLGDARRSLAGALIAHESEAEEWADFVTKFTAWVDSGAVLPDLPNKPPQG